MVVPNRNLLYTNHISVYVCVYERKYFDSHVVFYSAVTVRSTALFLSSYPPCSSSMWDKAALFIHTAALITFFGSLSFLQPRPL